MALRIADDFAAINAAGRKLAGQTAQPDWCWQRPARIKATEVGAENATILLNGEPVTRCVEADAEYGWVELILHDGKGRIVMDGDRPAIERRTGKVEIFR